jgi:hypothetical protein
LLIHLKKGNFKGFARLGTVAEEGAELEAGVDVADAVGSLTPGVEAL